MKSVTPVNPGNHAQRILVIKLSALGDFVLSLGAMRVIRDSHPSAVITLLTTKPYAELARQSPYIDIVETDGRPRQFFETVGLLRRIQRANYDVVYDLMGNKRTGSYFHALKWMSFGSPPLWNGTAKGCAFYYPNELRVKTHTIERLCAQLECAGLIPSGTSVTGNAPFPDLSWVQNDFGHSPQHQLEYFGLTSPYALIIPGASGRHKCWPAENYGIVAKEISEKEILPVLIGSSVEGDLGEKISLIEPRTKSLIGKTDLFQLVSLAMKAKFVVGNDTGPMHIATLAGANGIVLFATNFSIPEIHAPRGVKGKTVEIIQAPSFEDIEIREVLDAIGRLNG